MKLNRPTERLISTTEYRDTQKCAPKGSGLYTFMWHWSAHNAHEAMDVFWRRGTISFPAKSFAEARREVVREMVQWQRERKLECRAITLLEIDHSAAI